MSRESKNVIEKIREAHDRKTCEILAICGRVDYAYFKLLQELRNFAESVEKLKGRFKSGSVDVKLLREFSIKTASLALSRVTTYIAQGR